MFFALIVRTLSSPSSETPAAAERVHGAIAAGLGLIACGLTIWPWIGRGVPAFAHDWKWPLLRAQLDAWPSVLHSLWLPWGAGAPAVQELAGYPIIMTAWAIGKVASPALSLYVVLAAIFVICSAGAARCAQAFGLGAPWQSLIALLYPLAPTVTNRLSAGHLPWLLGYALVPWLLATAIAHGPSWARAGRVGALWGFAAAQVQFLVFAPLALLAAGRRVFRWDIAVATAIACGLQAPMIAALCFGHPTTAFALAHANTDWQLAQSSRATLALAGAADPAGYFQSFEPSAEWLLAPLLALALFGAFVAARAAPLALLWLGSTLWSAGMRGPLSAPLAYAFSHTLALSAFREFSHAQVLAMLPMLLLAAFGARALAGRRTAVAVAAFAILCIPAALPALAASAARLDTPMRMPAFLDDAVSKISTVPGNGAVLWVPTSQPMRTRDTRGGADSLALPVGDHPPFVEYRPSVPLIVAARALDARDPAACGLLADLGVQAVVERDDIAALPGAPGNDTHPVVSPPGLSMIAQGPGVRAYTVPCYRGVLTWAKSTVLRGDWSTIREAARNGATDEITLPPAPPRGIAAGPPAQPDYETDDIARGWVPLSQADAFASRFAGAFDDVAITARPDAPLIGPTSLASAGGAYKWLLTGRVRELLRRGPVAVWQSGLPGAHQASQNIVVDALPRTRALRAAAHAIAEGGPSLDYSGPSPPQGSLVVLHQHSSGGWQAFVDGVPLTSYPADGFAQGWIVERPGVLVVRYAAPPISLLWSIVFCAFAAALAMACTQSRTEMID